MSGYVDEWRTPEGVISVRLSNSRIIRDEASMDDCEFEAQIILSRLEESGFIVSRRNSSQSAKAGRLAMTDIVERLRSENWVAEGALFEAQEERKEAADEIERLERVNAAMLRESADWENIVNLRNAEIERLREALERAAAIRALKEKP